MNIYTNEGLKVFFSNEQLLDYIGEKLGGDIVRALEEMVGEEKKGNECLQYELDCYSESIRNLESSLLKAEKKVKETLEYIDNSTRINRNKIRKNLLDVYYNLDVNKIEY